MPSDLLIFPDGDDTVARDAFSGAELQRGTDAAAVCQAAVDALPPAGGSVRLASGTFLLERPVRLRSEVSLVGSGRATRLEVGGSNPGGTALHLDHLNRARVSELTCAGSGGGDDAGLILLECCGDCEVSGVYATGSGGCGILVRDNSFMMRLLNNTTSKNAKAGTRFSANNQDGRGGDWPPQLVSGCTSIGDLGHAFRISNTFCTNLVGCQSHQARGHGFLVDEHANSICLTGCRAYQGGSAGVRVDDSHEINVSSSIICWNLGNGIELNHVVWGTISANNVIDNGGRTAPAYGIALSGGSRTLQVSANAIFNWPGHQPMIEGVYEDDSCENNQVSNNNISFYLGEGVRVRGSGSVAHHNVCNADAYVHPGGLEIFPRDEDGNPIMTPLPEEEFTTDRIDRFLAE